MKNHIIYGMMAVSATLAMTACNDDDVNIYTDPIVSEVVTGNASTTATTATIVSTAADLSGQAADAYTVGVVYSTKPDPTVSGTAVTGAFTEGSTTFTTTITGLNEGVTYYYAAYVSLQGRLSYYGDVKSFVTTSSQVATADAAEVGATRATLGGTLNGLDDLLASGSLDYGFAVADRADGVKSSVVRINPETTTNSFTSVLENLVPNTTYHYATYVVVTGQEIFGDTKSFTTAPKCVAAEESAADYVDMGTKMEWCRYNVGADKESAPGALLAFGDITGLMRSANVADYARGTITATNADPAFTSGMGQLPSKEDFESLLAICDVTSDNKNGVDGFTLTSRKTGNSIFLPAAGTRLGDETSDAGLLGLYATGESYSDHSDYMHALSLNGGAAAMQLATRATAMSVRPVRKPYSNTIEVDNSKINVGDLEGNGRIRIEIYNEFGATAKDSPIDLSRLSFDNSMHATFHISGINDNLKEGAAGSYKAGFEFAAGGWDPSYWSAFDNNKFDCIVAGDGTYTVWMEPSAHSEGAVVFCIDINGLGADLVDASKIEVTVDPIVLDPAKPLIQNVTVDNTKVIFNNKDGNGTDGRIEIYNEYGDTKALGADYSAMSFPAGTMTITFTISGVTGNLKAGATANYTADLSYADADWYPSYWGGGCGTAPVNGDGTYTVQAHIPDSAEGAVVWCVEVYGLWQDLVDPSLVKVNIDKVQVPALAE